MEIWTFMQSTQYTKTESESKINFRVASKPGETIERLYDVIRGKLLFAVPPRVQKVVVSVGAKDLLDPRLMTLSQVRRGAHLIGKKLF